MNSFNRPYAIGCCFLLLLTLGTGSPGHCIEPPGASFDFAAIRSPVILKGDATTAYRDPAAVYHNGVFHLYFTVVKMEQEGAFWYLGYTSSRDLNDWLDVKLLTPRDRKLNFSSPGNIIRYDNQWVICVQTYPTPNNEVYGDETARLWILRSADLEKWSEPEMLRVKGADVPRGEMGRMIDPCLVKDKDEPGKWWCFYKQNGVSMSWSRDLKTWHYAGHRPAGENVCVLVHDNQYLMFHSPSNGMGLMRSNDLMKWTEIGPRITLGQKDWPWADARLTAGFVLDLRHEKSVGEYLMFFHGATSAGHNMHAAHGHGTLGLAFSDDLKKWDWPR